VICIQTYGVLLSSNDECDDVLFRLIIDWLMLTKYYVYKHLIDFVKLVFFFEEEFVKLVVFFFSIFNSDEAIFVMC